MTYSTGEVVQSWSSYASQQFGKIFY